jgi:hypothetical protein
MPAITTRIFLAASLALTLGSACSSSGGPSLDDGADAATGGYGVSTGGQLGYGTGGAYGAGGGLGTGGVPAEAGAGYVVTGNWHGYAWSSAGGAGSTITPADFSGRPLGQPFPLCASGTVAADAAYGGTAMVGINLNQGTGATDAAATVVPTGTGITVTVTNTGGSALRLQIQGPNGGTDANDRWCAVIPDGGGTIAFSDFNTECWEGGAGVAYTGQPLTAAIVLVPGDSTAAVPFDFCLNSLIEAGAVVVGGTGGATGSGGAATGGETSTGGAASGGSSSGGAASTGGSAGTGGSGTITYDGGYITQGPWHGYAWTAKTGTGSTLSPTSYSVTAPPLCASGTVAAGTANVAMIGLNLNQPKGDNPAMGTVVATDDGMLIDVTNNTAAALRVQIQMADGATNADHRWCAPLSNGQSFVPWDAFTTTCWNATGTAYAGQALVSAMVIVPGGASARAFDFCINSMVPGSDPAGPGGAGCDLSQSPGTGTGTLSAFTGDGSWAYVAGNRYAVQNNVWNGGGATHVISYSGASFTVTTQTGSQSTSGAPVSFPSIFLGSNYNRATTGSNMPKQVSALKSVPTGFSWTAASSGEYNATYDVYFSTSASGDAGSPSGGFMMVWLHKPTNAQPVGSTAGESVASLAGHTWNVWYGTQFEGKPVTSFVAQSDISSLSFDLLDFIKEAVKRGHLQNGWYLTNIMAGFEIWNGGQGLKANNFCAVVN